ncbi:hypothetical protein COO60DRAFT_741703 [Scenedesmus sp. NREL 46B-D3]|nr:hypothetical protein COO60DRAFT_741703 [Scenedesmus sp. NREL 46B-D3]
MQALRGAEQSKCSRKPQQQRRAAHSRSIRLQVHATSQPNQQQPFLSTAALTAAAAATVLQLCLPAAPALAQVPSAWQPVLGDIAAAAQLPAEQEDFATEILTEELALPPQLMSFMEMLQNGPVKDLGRLQEARRSVGFERAPDGRVLLLTEDGEPFQVKNDMGVPGLLLLRDAGGFCYYLPRSDADSLVQIDLSDDAVVAQLFANHAWEELVEPLEVLADDQTPAAGQSNSDADREYGRLEQLRLTERQFRSVVSLGAGGEELPEEPLGQLESQEQ